MLVLALVVAMAAPSDDAILDQATRCGFAPKQLSWTVDADGMRRAQLTPSGDFDSLPWTSFSCFIEWAGKNDLAVGFVSEPALPDQTCKAPVAVDGDSLLCGPRRLQLLGIEAPELHGCPRARTCVAGNGQASRQSLAAALRLGPIRYRHVAADGSAGSFVVAWAGTVNLSCWQLKHNQAIYAPRWDNRGQIASQCWEGD
jgi:endonuclease YncB( thermonuclease family)